MLFILLFSCACVQIVASQGVVPGVQNTCFQDPEPGTCKAYLPSFYYNTAAKYCDCFVYTGCSGNENRFDTLDECRYACNVASNQQIISNRCRNLLRGTAMLKQLLERPEFQGLETPKPPTPDRGSAKNVSKGQVPFGVDVDCLQPPEMGPCRAYLPSYFYDTENKYCDCFVYSGCGGNENRFRALNDCRLSCDVGPDKQIVTNHCKKILQGTSQWDEYLEQLSVPLVQDSTIDKIDLRKQPTNLGGPKDSTIQSPDIGINKDSSLQTSSSGANKDSKFQSSQIGAAHSVPQLRPGALQPLRPLPVPPPPVSSTYRDVLLTNRPSVLTYHYQKIKLDREHYDD